MPAPILPISGAGAARAHPPGRPEPAVAAGFRTCSPAPFSRWRPCQQNASASVERFLSGEGEELHTTILATQRADLAFDLFLQARNKVVSAYQEIMRMQM